MNDRELLELAALAAGMSIQRSRLDDPLHRDFLMNGEGVRNPGQCSFPWNPLDDDGDALRLAHRLGLAVDMSACAINFAIPDQDDSEMEIEVALEYEPFDGEIAHTRRAIVRAAAEIGKSMGGGE